MRALSIRQPYAELILRKIKKIEYRNRQTKIIGERFYIYAAMQPGDLKGFKELRCKPGELPTGVLVGTAIIAKWTRPRGRSKDYNWHLTGVKRLKHPRKPRKHPQPSWFNPF